MDSVDVLAVGRDAIYTMLIISGPLLAIGLVLGLIISFFQALTQIQELTLTFVPKIIAVFLLLLAIMPFIGAQMNGLMERLLERVIAGGG